MVRRCCVWTKIERKNRIIKNKQNASTQMERRERVTCVIWEDWSPIYDPHVSTELILYLHVQEGRKGKNTELNLMIPRYLKVYNRSSVNFLNVQGLKKKLKPLAVVSPWFKIPKQLFHIEDNDDHQDNLRVERWTECSGVRVETEACL